MQEDFSNWYASMSFQQDSAFTESRWAAIQDHVKAANKPGFALLARLAFGIKPQMGSPEVAELRRILAGTAPAPGDAELTMLSASALAAAMQSDADAVAALAATVVSCVSCGGLRKPSQPMDLVGMSSNVLRRLSETARRRPSLEQAKFATPTVDKNDEALLQAINSGAMPNVAQALATLTNKAISAMARRQREFESATQKYVNIQDEELDILWWLTGGNCFDLGLDFGSVAPEHLPLSVARELASLTKVLPGPPSLLSLLSRTGLRGNPPLPISDAVQSMPQNWLNGTVDLFAVNADSAILTPILFGVHRRNEVAGTEEWIGAWSITTDLPRDAPLSPLELASAAYREFSLVRLG